MNIENMSWLIQRIAVKLISVTVMSYASYMCNIFKRSLDGSKLSVKYESTDSAVLVAAVSGTAGGWF